MSELFDAAREVCDFMEVQRWEYCIIGGVAIQRWGEQRAIVDVDFTLLSEWGDEEFYIDRLLARFGSRITEPREFALKRRVILLLASNGRAIDISLGALAFEREMVARKVDAELQPGFVAPVKISS